MTNILFSYKFRALLNIGGAAILVLGLLLLSKYLLKAR